MPAERMLDDLYALHDRWGFDVVRFFDANYGVTEGRGGASRQATSASRGWRRKRSIACTRTGDEGPRERRVIRSALRSAGAYAQLSAGCRAVQAA